MPGKVNPNPVRGSHNGVRPGDGQQRGCYNRRLQRTLLAQCLQASDHLQCPPIPPPSLRRYAFLSRTLCRWDQAQPQKDQGKLRQLFDDHHCPHSLSRVHPCGEHREGSRQGRYHISYSDTNSSLGISEERQRQVSLAKSLPHLIIYRGSLVKEILINSGPPFDAGARHLHAMINQFKHLSITC